MRDGQRVSYIGSPRDGVAMGDRGEVISADAQSSHVLWHTGAREGAVMFVSHEDLSVGSRRVASNIDDGLEDSLEVGSLSMTAAREIYDEQGEGGILNAMAEQGHLASFSAIAQDALDFITNRIRHDPSFRALASQLDDEETESVIRLGAAVLMRDAFGVEE